MPPPNSQALLDKVIDATDKLSKRKKAIDDKLADIEPDMKKAVADARGPQIQVLRAALENEVTNIQDALESARRIVNDLRELSEDKAFVSKRILVVNTAARIVSELRDDLAKTDKRVDALIDSAEGGIKRSFTTEEHAQRGLAQLQMWQRQDEEQAAKTLKAAEVLVPKVVAAADSRSEKALETQRNAFDNLPRVSVYRDDLQRNRDRIAQWRKVTLGKGLGADVDKRLEQELKQLLAKVDAVEERYVLPLEKLNAKVMSLVIPSVDAKKAAQDLGVDPGQASKLGTILDGEPGLMEKALDTFLKQQKLALTGKQAIALLRKAKRL